MRAATKRFLASVAKRYPCAVLTGRARRGVLPQLRGAGIEHVVGNHGLEWGGRERIPAEVVRSVRKWRDLLSHSLNGAAGVRVENKRASLCIHYRGAPDKTRALRFVRKAARRLTGVRLVGGKDVLNVLPAGLGGKWEALERLCRETRCAKAVFVGDDETDEEVFARAPAGSVLTIHVGCRGPTRAGHCLCSQTEMDRFLAFMAGLR